MNQPVNTESDVRRAADLIEQSKRATERNQAHKLLTEARDTLAHVVAGIDRVLATT
jgi:hypothetical protein